jgi:uncharacterized LabA/DUF88 family protein
MERVCVFVDGSNFYFALKRNNYPTRVDYYELSKALAGPDRHLVRTYYFNSVYDSVLAAEQAKIQKTFYDSLHLMPLLDLHLGRIIPGREGRFITKGEKPLFSAQLVYYAARGIFDTAIVITEDQDFSDALTKTKELGKHVEICLFKDTQPRELIQASDRILPLSEVLAKFSSKIFPPDSNPESDPEDNIGNRTSDETTGNSNEEPVKRKRGRPRKTSLLDGLKNMMN